MKSKRLNNDAREVHSFKKARRLLSAAAVLLVLCLVLTAPAAAWGQDDYNIQDAADLEQFCNAVNSGDNFKDKIIKLTNDIDLGGTVWTPISGRFYGTFNGNGHSIHNFKLDYLEIDESYVDIYYSGFFVRLGDVGSDVGGVIQDLHLSILNTDINSPSGEYECVGGLVGQNYGTIKNCYVHLESLEVSSKATNPTNPQDIGGIVGSNYGTIENSHSSGEITFTYAGQKTGNEDVPTKAQVGGIAGVNANNGNNRGQIINCYSTCTVKGINPDTTHYRHVQNVGGIVGENSATVQNCYALNDEISEEGAEYFTLEVPTEDPLHRWNGEYDSSISAVVGTSNGNLASISENYAWKEMQVNGEPIGKSEDGTSPSGITLTNAEIWNRVFDEWDKDIWTVGTDTYKLPVLLAFADNNVVKYPDLTRLRQTYTVTFDTNAGDDTVENIPQDQKIDINDCIKQIDATPNRKNYVFVGWFSDLDNTDSIINFNQPITEDVTFYAKWEDAPGSEANPYLIDSYEILKEIANELSQSNPAYTGDKYYILTDDIEWDTNNPIAPIPNFGGILDGQGYKIIGMTLTTSKEHDGGIGLFKNPTGATIKNLIFEEPLLTLFDETDEFNTLPTDSSGIIANMITSGTISNCSVITGEITATQSLRGDSAGLGGIVGYLNGGTIENCYFSGEISSTSTGTASFEPHTIGGIAGFVSGGSTIQNCYTTGTLTVTSKGSSWTAIAGGIIGLCQENSPNVLINTCYSTAEVSVSSVYGDTREFLRYAAGGIIGFAKSELTIQNTIALNSKLESKLTSTNAKGFTYAGAIYGGSDNGVQIDIADNYAWNGIVITAKDNKNEEKPTSVSSAQVWNNQEFFKNSLKFDFDTVWVMSEEGEYLLPVLKAQGTPSSVPDLSSTHVPVTVTYHLNYETTEADPDGEILTKGHTATEPSDVVREGHNLAGWFTNYQCTIQWDFNNPVTENLNLYAKWKPKKTTITFKDTDGNTLDDAEFVYGKELPDLQISNPKNPGYTLTGWVIPSEEEDDILILTVSEGIIAFVPGEVLYTSEDEPVTWIYDEEGELTLKPQWEANTYTIIYDQNDGTAIPQEKSVKYDDKELASHPEVSRPGFVFTGWNDEEDGSGTSYATVSDFVTKLAQDDSASNILYAQWENAVSGVTIEPLAVTLPLEGTYSFSATVTLIDGVAENDTEEAKKILWTVKHNLSASTVITSDGILTIGADETASSFTVVATSAYNAEKFAEATVTIIPFKSDTTTTEDEETVYLIEDAEDLKKISELAADGDNSVLNYHYKVTQDITDINEPWTPIGDVFTGTFDGQGYTIKTLTNEDAGTPFGLFAENAGIIQNVNLTVGDIKANPNAENPAIGTLVGINQANGQIINCHITLTGDITGGNGGNTGGLAGENHGNIDDSSVTGEGGSITGNGDGGNTGGLVGENTGSITDSEVKDVEINDGNGDGNNIGGIAGENTGEIKDSTSSGNDINADGNDNNVGGIAGENGTGGNVTGSESSGNDIDSEGNNNDVGGIIGENNGDAENNTGNNNDVTSKGDNNDVGGNIGENNGNSENNDTTGGNVNSEGNDNNVGGNTGNNTGTSTDNDTTGGNVSSNGNGNDVGGNTGENSGTSTGNGATDTEVDSTGDNNNVGGNTGNNTGTSTDNDTEGGDVSSNGNGNDVGGNTGENSGTSTGNGATDTEVDSTGNDNNVGGNTGNNTGTSTDNDTTGGNVSSNGDGNDVGGNSGENSGNTTDNDVTDTTVNVNGNNNNAGEHTGNNTADGTTNNGTANNTTVKTEGNNNTSDGFFGYDETKKPLGDSTGSSGGSKDTGSSNYSEYPRSTENGGEVSFGTSPVVIKVILPDGTKGEVTLLTKPDTPDAEGKDIYYEFQLRIPGYPAGESGQVIFRLPASLMDEEFGASDYGVYTITEDGWKLLESVWAESGNSLIYTTEITDDGYFIIVKEKGASSKSETDAPVIEPSDDPQNEPDTPGTLPPTETPNEPTESPAPVLAVLAGLGAVVALRRK